MAEGVNKAILVGNLGKDPEIKQVNGTSVCKLSIATQKKRKNPNSGKFEEDTQWHQISAWGSIGENSSKYLKKGSKVFVEGEIKYEKSNKGSGLYVDIRADKIIFLDKSS